MLSYMLQEGETERIAVAEEGGNEAILQLRELLRSLAELPSKHLSSVEAQRRQQEVAKLKRNFQMFLNTWDVLVVAHKTTAYEDTHGLPQARSYQGLDDSTNIDNKEQEMYDYHGHLDSHGERLARERSKLLRNAAKDARTVNEMMKDLDTIVQRQQPVMDIVEESFQETHHRVGRGFEELKILETCTS